MTTPTCLRVFLDRLGWPPEQLAREINRRYGDGTISPKAPYHWLKGAYPRRKIPYAVAEILSEHLNEPIGISVIWPNGTDGATMPDHGKDDEAPRRDDSTAGRLPRPEGKRAGAGEGYSELVGYSCESLVLSREAATTNVDEAAFDQFEAELSAIGQAYAYVPPHALAHRTTLLRDRIAELLHGRQRPRQRVRLLGYAAKSCALLAWMTDDLDDHKAAHNHATAAWDLADLADLDDARRWVRVVQARQSFGLGHFVESADLAANGRTYRAGDGVDAVLLLQEARAWAAAGMTTEAQRALAGWRALPAGSRAGGRHPLVMLAPETQSYLAGVTLLLLRRPDEALAELDRSLDLLHTAAPVTRSRDVETLVRTYAARCHFLRGDIRTGIDVLLSVLDRDQSELTRPVRAAIAEARQDLAATGVTDLFPFIAERLTSLLSR